MSTAVTPAASSSTNGNTFQFVSRGGHTKVGYTLKPIGPPQAGHPFGGPSLSYEGPEGSFAFHGDQITQDDTRMGTVVSVVLKPQKDGGSMTFSLFVPPVVIDGTGTQNFATYAVKTFRPGNFQRPGAQLTYEMERFKGSAEFNRFQAWSS